MRFFLTRDTREQVKKATEMHPKMTAEAERMLAKLRVDNYYFIYSNVQ